MINEVDQVCCVCGGTFTASVGGKGRPQKGHRDCLDLQTRLAQVQSLINRISFADERHARDVAGDLFAIRNGIQKNFNHEVGWGLNSFERCGKINEVPSTSDGRGDQDAN